MGAFDVTIGALLLGLALNLYLYGVVSYQYVIYKTTKFTDPIWLRALVATLFVIDTSQTVVELYALWFFAVGNYARPSVLGNIIWITPLCGMGSAISSLIVQAFLINRLRILIEHLWLCIPLLLVAIAACLCGIIACTKSWLLVDITKFAVLIPVSTAWLAIEAGVDIIITVTLSRALWRSKTGFVRTDTIVNRCIRVVIQSGLFSSVFAIMNFLVFILRPDTYLYAIFNWPLGRIYSNSLIYTLVARRELSGIARGTVEFADTGSNAFPMSPQRGSIHSAGDSDRFQS
ncbi:hypothetical protein DL96DRAFT_1611727 [Flagelloscypha sp. PMI_526]|nr:hypothetical protein DL96DRAFT_1611727 [Flagelloscypha sp. PMI_526]